MAIGNMLAVLCYYGIILRHSDQSPVTPFLVTFGIVLPLTWCIPFIAMDSLDIRSTVLRMGLVALPICVPLTCLQGKLEMGWITEYCLLLVLTFYCTFVQLTLAILPTLQNGRYETFAATWASS